MTTTPQRRACVMDYHLSGPPSALPAIPGPGVGDLQGHLHGWLYHLCSPDGARRQGHDGQRIAPFGAWLLPDGHRGRRPGTITVRVCWYGEDACHRATAALARAQSCVLGGTPYALQAISPVTRQPVGPMDLLDRGEDALTVRLRTLTPVGFRRHTRWHCGFEPPTVLGSAAHRWERVWPGTLPWKLEGMSVDTMRRTLAWLGRVAVRAMELRSSVVRRSKVQQACVRGWAEYDLYALRAPQRRLALALLRGAELLGLGSRCAYGLGAISVERVR